MAALSDKMRQRMEAWANEVMREMGRDGVKLIKQLASVRVVRQGDLIIRSDPGEPPRRDEGTLYKSIKYRLEKTNGRAVDIVFYSTDKPVKLASLEDGADHMEARPLWKPAKRLMGNTRRVFKQRMNDKIRNFRADPFNSLGTLYAD